MYAQKHHSGYFPVAEGIARKTLVHGKNTLITEFVLKKGAVLPAYLSGPRRDLWYRVRWWGFAHPQFED